MTTRPEGEGTAAGTPDTPFVDVKQAWVHLFMAFAQSLPAELGEMAGEVVVTLFTDFGIIQGRPALPLDADDAEAQRQAAIRKEGERVTLYPGIWLADAMKGLLERVAQGPGAATFGQVDTPVLVREAEVWLTSGQRLRLPEIAVFSSAVRAVAVGPAPPVATG